jgi:hypothetical protein
MTTGSNTLILQGGGIAISSSIGYSSNQPIPENPTQRLYGPGLGVIHSFNKYAQLRKLAVDFPYGQPEDGVLGIPNSFKMNTGSVDNYHTLNISETAANTINSASSFFPDSAVPGIDNYEDFNIPFLINKGDEIRVTWNPNSGSATPPFWRTEDFTVVDTPTAPSTDEDYFIFINTAQFTGDFFFAPSSSIYNQLTVYPDPSNFDIVDGEIQSFTIRRRVNADDRVIVYQTPPTGSAGINTLSPSGYLIPNDFSPIQKRNVQTIINQLKAKNAFSSDEANDNSNSNMQS